MHYKKKKDISGLKEEYRTLGITKFCKKYRVSAKRVYDELGYLSSEETKRFVYNSRIRKINEPLKYKYEPDKIESPPYEGPFSKFINKF